MIIFIIIFAILHDSTSTSIFWCGYYFCTFTFQFHSLSNFENVKLVTELHNGMFSFTQVNDFFHHWRTHLHVSHILMLTLFEVSKLRGNVKGHLSVKYHAIRILKFSPWVNVHFTTAYCTWYIKESCHFPHIFLKIFINIYSIDLQFDCDLCFWINCSSLQET